MNRTDSFTFAAALAAALLASGCATLTTGSSQTVTVQTDPAGAVCTFRRDGEVIGIINPTPGTISVQKHRLDIDVRCTKDGYLDEAGLVGSKFQAMTFGNILFGGLIGVVVDAASGAAMQYDPAITIVMVPARFPDAQARDVFFDRRRDTFLAESKKVKDRIASMCGGADCARQLKDAELAESAALARLDEQRRNAQVGSP
jgi:hypothetical protein